MLGRWVLIGIVAFLSPASAQEMADAYYDTDAMNKARKMLHHHHGQHRQLYLGVDRFEYQAASKPDNVLWDADAWYGGDVHKLWLRTEGGWVVGEGQAEHAETSLLYSRAIHPFLGPSGWSAL